MDALREFFDLIKTQRSTEGHFLGLLHLLIGRRITKQDGTVVTQGVAWRDLAVWLKKVRWHKADIQELGLDPADLPLRDRERYWYTAIVRAGVDSAEAIEAGNQLAEKLKALGYVVGPPPK